jgi:hypothetical protein
MMKTKDLIRELQDADPTGEMHVTVGKRDIHFIGQQPYYYDGNVEKLIRDESADGYNIIGAEYPTEDHIKIFTLSIETAVWNDPEMPVYCYWDKDLENRINDIRIRSRNAK